MTIAGNCLRLSERLTSREAPTTTTTTVEQTERLAKLTAGQQLLHGDIFVRSI